MTSQSGCRHTPLAGGVGWSSLWAEGRLKVPYEVMFYIPSTYEGDCRIQFIDDRAWTSGS